MKDAEKQTYLRGKQRRVVFLTKNQCTKTDARGKTYKKPFGNLLRNKKIEI